ncbi:unnamed protein product [Rotaria sp. Silwood1]|nr:unnamed protein product [Rotaria sp. Silwood1]
MIRSFRFYSLAFILQYLEKSNECCHSQYGGFPVCSITLLTADKLLAPSHTNFSVCSSSTIMPHLHLLIDRLSTNGLKLDGKE